MLSLPTFSTPIEFETERLTLRQWSETDYATFPRINSDPKVMEYFPKLLTPSESDELAQALQGFIRQHGFGLWAAEITATGEFIGFVGLSVPNAELPFSPCVEVAWRIAATHWGKAFAPEAAKEALRIGFEMLDLTEIVSFTAVGNHRSRKVMEKLSMQEDLATFEHPSIAVGHPLEEHCLYRISYEYWLQNLSSGRKLTRTLSKSHF